MRATDIAVIGGRTPVACRQGIGSDCQVVARSAAMRDILAGVSKIANTSIPVLLQGEIGVGKKAIAREIHRHSACNTGPFVRVACEALTESELSEILAAEPGEHRRADTGRPAGPLEASQRGTLFLDGIAQLPLRAQVKLLDVLQSSDGQNRQNGAIALAQARVIASSTCDLQSLVVENRFYARLYYYLNAVAIDVPPLRHRQEDILVLAKHFLVAAVSELSPPRNQLRWHFSEEARQSLLRYDWPGNVLQLGAVVAHAALLAEGPEIGQAAVARLLGGVRRRPEPEMFSLPLTGSLKEMELALIGEVVRRCRGNKAAAARALGLHRRTLYRLLEE